MAKKNVVIFDGEDKFINPKKAVYSKSKGQAKKVESFKSLRAALMDEEGQGPVEVADDNVSNNQTTVGGGTATAIEAPSQYVIPNLPENLVAPPIPILSDIPAPPVNLPSLGEILGGGGASQAPSLPNTPCPQGWFWDGTQCNHETPVDCPNTSIWNGSNWVCPEVTRNTEYIERPSPINFGPITQDTYVAPTPQLPNYDDRKTIMPIYDQPIAAPSPITQEPIYTAPPTNDDRKTIMPIYDQPVSVNAPIPELPSTPSYQDEFRKVTFPIADKPIGISTSTVMDDVFLAPTPSLPNYNDAPNRGVPSKEIPQIPIVAMPNDAIFGNNGNPPSVDAKSPVSGIGLTFGENSGVKKTCPDGMRDYFGTCIPIQNQYAVCQQGYMKEYEGGPCVPIPASGALGGCAAGYEYKMGYRSGSLTPEMGCYPIGSYQDINTGGSTGAILGGGTGSNIGGGGTVQGGGGIYGDLDSTNPYPNKNYNCPEYTVYDPVSGQCRAAYENAVVPCPAGFTLNKATGTCIESLNPQDYKCPPINLPNPPRCKKYAVVGKDTFGCDRFELVDDAANCPDVIEEKPIECQDGLIYSEALKKCVNPIDETKRPPLTTPEGTCPDDYTWNVAQQKCIAKCPTGQAWDPVNFICVDATKPKTPYCSANQVWDETQQKCVFTGTTTKPPVTSQTTTTTTKKPTTNTLGEPPTGGGGVMGGGGGGGSEEAPAAAIAKKNYFWWYVGGAVLAYYVYSKYNKKK
jgi:hypothetical protein